MFGHGSATLGTAYFLSYLDEKGLLNSLCGYMLKYCRESFTRYKARGACPSALFRVKHEQGNALKNLQSSLVHCNLNDASLFIFVSYNYAQVYASRCFVSQLLDRVLPRL